MPQSLIKRVVAVSKRACVLIHICKHTKLAILASYNCGCHSTLSLEPVGRSARSEANLPPSPRQETDSEGEQVVWHGKWRKPLAVDQSCERQRLECTITGRAHAAHTQHTHISHAAHAQHTHRANSQATISGNRPQAASDRPDLSSTVQAPVGVLGSSRTRCPAGTAPAVGCFRRCRPLSLAPAANRSSNIV